jgi:uncharacterized phage-associated protein
VVKEIVFSFDEQKVTEAAVQLLRLAGGRMGKLRLMKLLYLADRESLDRNDRPISGDRYYSLPHGPILSRTLDIINGTEAAPAWETCLDLQGSKVLLVHEIEPDALSRIEIDILRAVHERFKGHSDAALRSHTHRLPEYQDPECSRIPIGVPRILCALRKSEDEVEDVRQAAEVEAEFRRVFG